MGAKNEVNPSGVCLVSRVYIIINVIRECVTQSPATGSNITFCTSGGGGLLLAAS